MENTVLLANTIPVALRICRYLPQTGVSECQFGHDGSCQVMFLGVNGSIRFPPSTSSPSEDDRGHRMVLNGANGSLPVSSPRSMSSTRHPGANQATGLVSSDQMTFVHRDSHRPPVGGRHGQAV